MTVLYNTTVRCQGGKLHLQLVEQLTETCYLLPESGTTSGLRVQRPNHYTPVSDLSFNSNFVTPSANLSHGTELSPCSSVNFLPVLTPSFVTSRPTVPSRFSNTLNAFPYTPQIPLLLTVVCVYNLYLYLLTVYSL